MSVFFIRFITVLSLFLGLCACQGEQSVFSSAGSYADSVVQLTYLMFIAALAITLLIVGLTGIALFANQGWKEILAKENMVVWGGIVFPVVTLSALLIYGFVLLSRADMPIDDDKALHISVVGEQWWWRFIYTREDGSTFETANEMRIPTNTPIVLHLSTADVIHSFWIPAYGGKLDMIPGRENIMKIKVQRSGIYRGQCAEYCGGAHALMSMYSVAMPPEEFSEWLSQEGSDAVVKTGSAGGKIFIENGCGSCHSVRGTAATGKIGPDLTHVGSRLSIGAGTLRTSEENIENWINNHRKIKPDNLMPEFNYLSDKEVSELATFLFELK